MRQYYLIITILCFACGCAGPSELSRDKRGQALALYNKGENQAAIKCLNQSEKIKPNQRNDYWLGQIYFKEADFPEAIEHLEKSNQQDYRLAYAYYKNSQIPQAIEICRRIIAKGYDKTPPLDWHEIIDLTQKLGQIDLLISAKKQELLTSPSNSLIYSQLAQLYNKNNQPALAIACAQRSIYLYPNEKSAYPALAKAYASQKQYDSAISCLDTYIKNMKEEYK
jgi:tetratricopeptide (TPR) repeat protein